MKRILTCAALVLAAVSCNKRTLDESIVPPTPDASQPIQFGTGAPDVELTKANITLGDGQNGTLKMDKLGIFAFLSSNVPTTATAATAALWQNSSNEKTANVSYSFFDDGLNTTTSKYYREEVAAGAKARLFWPASGGNQKLTFLGYFPGIASATAMPAAPNQLAYVNTSTFELKADLSDQTLQTGKSAVYDYGFAWAKPLEGVARTNPVTRQKLEFTYKVAKLSLTIKGDTEDGLTVSAGGAKDKGLKAVRVYSATSGLCSDYTLNLLTGVPAAGTILADSANAIELQPVANPGDATAQPDPILPYVTATGYLVPATAAALNAASDPKNNGIVVEVVYNDGDKDETYKATINTESVKNPTAPGAGKPDLTGGIEAGKNYKYTVKFGKAGLTFTGQVVDWVDADPIPDIDLD